MKRSFLPVLTALASGVAGFFSSANAQPSDPLPAYLEVVPLTLQWNRTTSTIVRSRVSDTPVNVDSFVDPDPVALVVTDTVRTVRDLPLQNHSAFIAHLTQGVGVTAPSPWTFLGNRNIIVDLVAVRVPARSVAEFATNRYYLYLMATDRRTGVNPAPPELIPDYDSPESAVPVATGLTLQLGQYINRAIETFDSSGRLFNVTGSIATSFKIDYSATFYPNFPSVLPRRMFIMNARGTGNYPIRTIKLPASATTPNYQPAFLVSGATTLRGVGYHAHDYLENINPITNNYTSLGLAPVTIVLGQAKFVSRERFPEFPVSAAP